LSPVPECRNWQTNRTQNPAHFTVRVGSSPTSANLYFASSAEFVGEFAWIQRDG
jgi:hypothetical protein